MYCCTCLYITLTRTFSSKKVDKNEFKIFQMDLRIFNSLIVLSFPPRKPPRPGRGQDCPLGLGVFPGTPPPPVSASAAMDAVIVVARNNEKHQIGDLIKVLCKSSPPIVFKSTGGIDRFISPVNKGISALNICIPA